MQANENTMIDLTLFEDCCNGAMSEAAEHESAAGKAGAAFMAHLKNVLPNEAQRAVVVTVARHQQDLEWRATLNVQRDENGQALEWRGCIEAPVPSKFNYYAYLVEQ